MVAHIFNHSTREEQATLLYTAEFQDHLHSTGRVCLKKEDEPGICPEVEALGLWLAGLGRKVGCLRPHSWLMNRKASLSSCK